MKSACNGTKQKEFQSLNNFHYLKYLLMKSAAMKVSMPIERIPACILIGRISGGGPNFVSTRKTWCKKKQIGIV